MMTSSQVSSRFAWLLRGTAFAAAPVLLTACGQSGQQQAVPTEQPSGEATEAMAGAAPEQAGAVVDESAATPLTNVVPVPVAAQADPAAAAPLADAAAITTEISKGDGIERIRQGDGWAWRRDGKIIRTASSDGKRVAYFRNGSDTPFLVQDDRQAYAYSDGKVTHHYDNGRAKTIDDGDREDARKLVTRARDDRDSAAHIAETNPVRHGTRPTPTPTPSPSRTRDDTSHHHGATPTPTPSPTPTHSTRETSHMTSGSGRTASSSMRGASSSTMRSTRSSDTMRSTRPRPTPTPT